MIIYWIFLRNSRDIKHIWEITSNSSNKVLQCLILSSWTRLGATTTKNQVIKKLINFSYILCNIGVSMESKYSWMRYVREFFEEIYELRMLLKSLGWFVNIIECEISIWIFNVLCAIVIFQNIWHESSIFIIGHSSSVITFSS